MRLVLVDGRVFERHIEHAAGSTDNPMSDRELDAKFRALAQGVLPEGQLEAVLEKCRAVGELENVAEIARLAVP